MTVPEPSPVNHHADHPGFSGVTGAIVGVILLLRGRANARLAAEVTDVSAGDRVIDVGSGPGGAVREAARRGATVTGVDPSPVMLRLARIVTRARGVEWVEGTAEHVPRPDGSATVWWSLATVHHWQDVGKGLGEAHRLLAPNGRLLAVERRVQPGATGLASHGWTHQQAESFAAQCRTAGFADVVVDQPGRGRHAVWAVSATRP
ncbi:class I SAM-dependent methyltransferase [Mycobacterium sp. 2YAF39]|uniref:class I SAM-dependent methyltransferase n=1 Tax=Mycobacterium sp. 2YAF39 TaxID=3233033 RepID=UPI003F97F8D3